MLLSTKMGQMIYWVASVATVQIKSFSNDSNIMIANFQLKEKLCKRHKQPQAFLCLNKGCSTHSLLCSSCIRKDHSHLASVYSLDTFIQYFSEFVQKAKARLEDDRCCVDMVQVIRSKRQEVQQLHLQLVEKVMKKLSEEKKAVCQSLDLMERAYVEKEAALKKNQQMRQDIVNYLLPYSQDEQLVDLKLKTASGWALTRIKEHLAQLENLTNSFDKACFLKLEYSAMQESSQKLQGTFFKSLAKFMKEQSIMAKPPLPERLYTFVKRPLTPSRPSSSVQKRNMSYETGTSKSTSARQL